MIKKVTERSSAFVVVSRKTLLSGMAGIALLSFGLGYFLAYGGPAGDKMVKQVEADNKVVPSEEKRVLDSQGKPTLIVPPATPDAIPKEPPPAQQKVQQAEQKPAAAATPQKPEEQKKPLAPVQSKAEPDMKRDAQASAKKSDREQTSTTQPEKQLPNSRDNKKLAKFDEKRPEISVEPADDDQAKKKSLLKSRPKKHKQKHKAKAKKGSGPYAAQVGSFTDSEKAKRFKDELSDKGYKSYLTTYSPESGKVYVRVRIGSYAAKDEAENLIAELNGKGVPAILVRGIH